MSRPSLLPRRAAAVALPLLLLLAVASDADALVTVPTGQSIETRSVHALAAGGGHAAWLAETTPGHWRLVVRDPGAAPRTIDQPLPTGTFDLAVGTDAHGAATVVVNASPGAHRARLWTLPADGSRPPKPLPASPARTYDVAPGLARGVITFSRKERVHGRVRYTVRVARLTGRTSRRAWNGAAQKLVTGTTPLADGRAAFVTFALGLDDPLTSSDLRLLRGSGGSRLVEHVGSGGAAAAAFGALQASDDGSRLFATRWTDDRDAHPADVTTFRASTGELLLRSFTPDHAEGDQGVSVPDGRIYSDAGDIWEGEDTGLFFLPVASR